MWKNGDCEEDETRFLFVCLFVLEKMREWQRAKGRESQAGSGLVLTSGQDKSLHAGLEHTTLIMT